MVNPNRKPKHNYGNQQNSNFTPKWHQNQYAQDRYNKNKTQDNNRNLTKEAHCEKREDKPKNYTYADSAKSTKSVFQQQHQKPDKDTKGTGKGGTIIKGTPSIKGFFAAQAKPIETANRFKPLDERMETD